jgi:ubiquinone/menaquinone biosynthesis C-methylase UbiE
MKRDLLEKENREIEYWKTSPIENPDSDSIENLVNVFSVARVFLHKLSVYEQYFQEGKSFLELGGGQGWASCILKKKLVSSQVYLSDISEYAIASAHKWESIFNVSLDQKVACKSYEIPYESESLDVVFCFEAAHHFVAQRKSLKEIYRVLKKGGICLYLYEPVCPGYMYQIYYKYINAQRPEDIEDVLVYSKIEKIAKELGFSAKVNFDSVLLNKNTPKAFIYHSLLKTLPLLKYYLPANADFIFEK